MIKQYICGVSLFSGGICNNKISYYNGVCKIHIRKNIDNKKKVLKYHVLKKVQQNLLICDLCNKDLRRDYIICKCNMNLHITCATSHHKIVYDEYRHIDR